MDEEFYTSLDEIKPFFLNLPQTEKKHCALWIKKLCDSKDFAKEKKNRNLYAKLLFHMLKCGNLELPFTNPPNSNSLKNLPAYLCLLLEECHLFQTSFNGHQFEKIFKETNYPQWIKYELSYSDHMENSVDKQEKSLSIKSSDYFSKLKTFILNSTNCPVQETNSSNSLSTLHKSLEQSQDLRRNKVVDPDESESIGLQSFRKDRAEGCLEKKVRSLMKAAQANEKAKCKDEEYSSLVNEIRQSLEAEYEAKYCEVMKDVEKEKLEWKEQHVQSIRQRLANIDKKLMKMKNRYNCQIQRTKTDINELEHYLSQLIPGEDYEKDKKQDSKASNKHPNKKRKAKPSDETFPKKSDKWKPNKLQSNFNGESVKIDDGVTTAYIKEEHEDTGNFPFENRKNFSTPKALDDEYLSCDACQQLYLECCPSHGSLTNIPDTPVEWDVINRACKTCPDGVKIGPSKVKQGCLGAWAEKDFPAMRVFGPYEGVVQKKKASDSLLIFNGGYVWEIYKQENFSHCIDGSDLKKSSWLRYVNCISTKQHNLKAYQYKGQIFYRTCKEIKSGMELLFWFDQRFAGKPPVEREQARNDVLVNNKFAEDHRQCKRCGVLFADEESVLRHIKVKHPERSSLKRFRCNFCSYSSNYKSTFIVHTRMHTNEKPFKCAQCSKAFSRKYSLKLHVIRVHTSVRLYPCDLCSSSFNTSANLRAHILSIHDKRKPYVCIVCGFASATSSALKQHMIVHTGERNYQCRHCEKKFALSSTLKNHERLHTGERPHKCNQCPAAYIKLRSLRLHERKQHS